MANDKRLISYDVLMKHLDSCIKEGKGLVKSLCVAIKCFVEQMPAVDAVEVVRCRDCKHLVLTAEGEHNPCDCVCDYWMSDGLNDNDFCSYGERKGGDD